MRVLYASLHICVYMYISKTIRTHAHTYIHTYINTNKHTYKQANIHTYIRTNIRTYIKIHTRKYIQAHKVHKKTYKYAPIWFSLFMHNEGHTFMA